MRTPGARDWIAWLGAALVACAALTSFAYQTFQTKDDSRHYEGFLIERLDRIENKLDAALERK